MELVLLASVVDVLALTVGLREPVFVLLAIRAGKNFAHQSGSKERQTGS